MATTRGFLSLVDFLLDHGADINNAEAGYTVLHWASGVWDSELTIPSSGVVSDSAVAQRWLATGGIHAPEKLEFVKRLVARGADIRAQMAKNPLRARGEAAARCPAEWPETCRRHTVLSRGAERRYGAYALFERGWR
jgi:hypothetical protein